MFVEWEYGKSGEDQGMGYWTSENMNKLVPEYIALFNFLYPGHFMLLNIDWSANYNAMAPDARMLVNMCVCVGGERTRDGEVERMPVFEKYKLEVTKEDIGPNVPTEWKSKIQEGTWFHFDFNRYPANVPDPFFIKTTGPGKRSCC